MFAKLPEDIKEIRQGDVLVGVPIPVFSEASKFGIAKTRTKAPAMNLPQNSQAFDGADSAAHTIYRGPALVISQCCDLDNIDATSRVLVCPIVPEDNSRFQDSLGAQARDAMKMDEEYFSDLLLFDGPEEKAKLDKNAKLYEKQVKKHLEALWLGNTIGAFPIAASPPAWGRGVCFFDGVVGVPGAWKDKMQQLVRARLTEPWRQVLQEKLRGWLGRYAYPGDNRQRLADGGLD